MNISSKQFNAMMAAKAAGSVPSKPRKLTPRRPAAVNKVLAVPSAMTFWVPVRTYSEPNRRDHWTGRDARRETQQQGVQAVMGRFAFVFREMGPRWTVTLCRVGPNRLDDDNLAASLKAVRDAVAKLIGVDDGPDAPVAWRYDQDPAPYRKVGYMVWVRVERADEMTAS